MQRYFSKEKLDDKFLLSSDDYYHIKKVMRMQTGDKIEVVYNSKVYICELNIENTECKIYKELDDILTNTQKVTLIIPLLKEQKLDLILQKSTELGVDEIIPVVMERSIVKIDDSKMDKKIERWVKICKEAAEQSKRINIPSITAIKRLKELENLDGLKIVCSTIEKENTIKKFLTTNKNYDRINVVIGPEGGISLKEEELLVNLGFNRVSLGDRIMRVETVPLFILSVLNYENME